MSSVMVFPLQKASPCVDTVTVDLPSDTKLSVVPLTSTAVGLELVMLTSRPNADIGARSTDCVMTQRPGRSVMLMASPSIGNVIPESTG